VYVSQLDNQVSGLDGHRGSIGEGVGRLSSKNDAVVDGVREREKVAREDERELKSMSASFIEVAIAQLR
jgi:hypothetical protein